ncbi:MAG: AsmA-like C-terminal region-containing protein, partial [Usitatibacter sp.]
ILMLGRKHSQVQLRCMVAGFEAKGGVFTATDFVLDTDDTVVNIEGSIDMGRETLDLEAYPQPKDHSLVALRTPLTMKGPLRNPKVRPKAGPLATRVVAALALGAVAPPLALLALLETGPGKDAPCARLLRDAKAKGAVKKAS